MAKVLFVLTSHTILGSTGRETGFYFDEMATPYWKLIDAGHTVTIASIAGGTAQHDPGSINADASKRPAPVARFLTDPAAMAQLSATPDISAINPDEFDAVFLPGGHGTMYDFPENADLAAVVGRIWQAGGVVSAVCHGPAGLLEAKHADGRPLVMGMRVNSFTDAEEAAAGLTTQMPFLLETRLRDLGAVFESTDNFQPHAVRDGRLVTGQNPASALLVAEHLVAALAERTAQAPEHG